MKKIILLLVICILAFTFSVQASEAPKEITVYVDGSKLEFDVPPTSEKGRTLVPMRYIFEALGAEVKWSQEENKVIATKDDIIIHITPGNSIMYRNDAPITLDVPAKAVDGRTLVPVRAISEALDAKVVWDGDTYTVNITSPVPYVPGEYHYTELSERDLETLREIYPDLFDLYATRTLYENMAAYPSDVANLIKSEDARIRMFADDVWNNLIAHIIITIQTESDDMYIFDIPEELEIDSYTLMEDYFAITDKEKMSAEYSIETKFSKTPKGKSVLEINFVNSEAGEFVPTIYVVETPDNDFRYFVNTDEEMFEFTKEGPKGLTIGIGGGPIPIYDLFDRIVVARKPTI